mmetsp:Transcript_10303/g.19777  ORF Transcript_10303/g.19777 Transcript_10303/m.19777 type:complete len:241 (-) Transcript_10303:2359-3081(-)|eukprot:scaffold609_cov170-Amphora_coffeaeformis.AAC.5
MCWSSQVSLNFALLDTCFAVLLAVKALDKKTANSHNPQPNVAIVYADIMTCVAIQEWAQFGIWRRWDQVVGLERKSYCSIPADAFLSFLSTTAAEAVPVPFIVASFSARHNSKPYYNQMGQLALLVWTVQAMLVLLSVALTHKYCVELGPNHHQVWICESACYSLGGPSLHYISFFLYVLSCLLGTESVENLPLNQRRCIEGISLLTGVVSVFWFGPTLEACSVWCWSAFALGVYLCAVV